MPTPVHSAKQCLTTDSASALDEAVSIARRRGHAQTTSLHAVSAFLSLSSSPLRDACLRARNTNNTISPLYTNTGRYHHHRTPPLPLRSQLRALDFALSLSLDRTPASPQRVTEPPISNSLMAAIKRSQANQRRQPENFTAFGYRQRELEQVRELGSGAAGVKVEIQNLILSILDDPIVSRVFNEAGFSSFEIKLAMVRPLQSLWRFTNFNNFPRNRRPPPPPSSPGVFICDIESYNHHHHHHHNPDHPSFRNFPFSTSGFPPDSDHDSNHSLLPIEDHETTSHFHLIGEVMKERKNPLLLGVSASNILQSFIASLESTDTKHKHLLPPEIRGGGVSVINLESEISNLTNDKNCNEGKVNAKFQELGLMVEQCQQESFSGGLVLCIGDLKTFLETSNHEVDFNRWVVVNLTKLWEDHREKKRLWLIGSSTHEVYLKFSSFYSSVEKDWDIRPVPITCTMMKNPKPPPSIKADDFSFKSSLMGSFVPFAGFFSSPTEVMKGGRLRSTSPFIPAGGLSSSLAVDPCKTKLPVPLLQQEAEANRIHPLKSLSPQTLSLQAREAIDDTCMVRSATATTGLLSKLEDCPSPKPNTCREEVRQVPSLLAREKKAKTNDDHSIYSPSKTSSHDTSSDNERSINGKLLSDVEKKPLGPSLSNWFDQLVPTKTQSNSPSKAAQYSLISSPYGTMDTGASDDHLSQMSFPPKSRINSVDTDLMLGLLPPPSRCKWEEDEPTGSPNKNHHRLPEYFSSSFLPQDNDHVLNQKLPPSKCSLIEYEASDPKSLFQALIARIGRQDEALRVISHTITRARSNEGSRINSGGIWLNFTGHDTVAQKTTALALAEVVCGSKDSFIHVDLCSDNAVTGEHAIRGIGDGGLSSGGSNLRKSMVDQVAERLRKVPLSVVFFENLHNAHPPMQCTLIHAIKHGKFMDSHGREVSTSNAIFVLRTSRSTVLDKSRSDESSYFSEERVTKTRASPVQLTVSSPNSERWSVLNKKKIIRSHERTTLYADSDTSPRAACSKGLSFDLDLNFPAEEETELGCSDYHCEESNEPSSSWLEDLVSRVDSKVVFQPFDYDALAAKLVVLISRCFSKAFCSDCHLEIESRVMDQMLPAIATAAACSWEKKTEMEYQWVEEGLGRRFVEAQRIYHRQSAAHCAVKLVIAGPVSSMEGQRAAASCGSLPSEISLKIRR